MALTHGQYSFPLCTLGQVRNRRCFADGNQYLINTVEFYLLDGCPRGVSRSLYYAFAERAAHVCLLIMAPVLLDFMNHDDIFL